VPLATKSLLALLAVLLIATPALAMGTVEVSGEDLTIGGVSASSLVGVDESTALVFAVLAHCEGQVQYWGKNMNFPEPDTGTLECDELIELWHQYFWLCNYYDLNLVRIGFQDKWATGIAYTAWTNHQAMFLEVIDVMLHEAAEHEVYVELTLAGSQEWPAYTFGGSGNAFDVTSTAFRNFIIYESALINATDAMDNHTAIFAYDCWNEPDSNQMNAAYWDGDQVLFREWAENVSSRICPWTTHIVDMGTGGGNLFGWGYDSFYNMTGGTGFDICHMHIYGSVEDEYLIADRLDWASTVGKPLFIGEIARNNVYPLQRWSWFESRLVENGADAWCNMVLRGTEGYPFTGSIPGDEEPPTEAGGGEIVPEPPSNDTAPGNETELPPPPGNDTAPGNETELPPPSNEGNASGNETAAPPPSNDTSSPTGDASEDSTGNRSMSLTSRPMLVVPFAFTFLIMAVLVLSIDGRRRF